MKNKFVQLVIFTAGIVLIINLSAGIRRLLGAFDQIKVARQKVVQLEEEKQLLSEKKKYYQSEEFIEEEARNKLNMARLGETIIILPPNLEQVLGQNKVERTPPLPNWQRWWKLFF